MRVNSRPRNTHLSRHASAEGYLALALVGLARRSLHRLGHVQHHGRSELVLRGPTPFGCLKDVDCAPAEQLQMSALVRRLDE